jgi:hypothetical protein
MALVVLGVMCWTDVEEEGAVSIMWLQLFFNLSSASYLIYVKLPVCWAHRCA